MNDPFLSIPVNFSLYIWAFYTTFYFKKKTIIVGDTSAREQKSIRYCTRVFSYFVKGRINFQVWCVLLCCQPQFLSLNFLQLSTAATASPVFHVIGTRVDTSIRSFPDATYTHTRGNKITHSNDQIQLTYIGLQSDWLLGVIHILRGQPRGGVDEMTMNDHEGEGRAIKMTMWSLGLKCILRQIKKYLREFSIWTVA